VIDPEHLKSLLGETERERKPHPAETDHRD
jgi:hypothetical protein